MADLDHRLDTNATSMVLALLDLAQNHLPEPQQAYEGLLAWLERSFYPSLSSTITQFIRGPLALEAALAHGQLAGQPFAAAHARALRRRRERPPAHRRPTSARASSYERLLRRFARREIVKHRPGLPDRDLDEAD